MHIYTAAVQGRTTTCQSVIAAALSHAYNRDPTGLGSLARRPLGMDAAAREAQGGLEWRVTVPEGASVTVVHEAVGDGGGAAARAAWAWLLACAAAAWGRVAGFARKVWMIGADDPRKAVHGLKVGLALALVSVFYYTRPLYDGVGGAAMWAIMTVVVVFEYTVGESSIVTSDRDDSELQLNLQAPACMDVLDLVKWLTVVFVT